MNIELADKHKIKIRTDKDLYPIMREILLQASNVDRNKEHLWICGIAANNLLLYIELVGLGSMYETKVEPMDVFAWALQKQVAMIVMVHNHPTDKLVATPADRDLTDRMIQVGNIVNIKVVDHLIITPDGYYSFEKHGLMKKLRLSKKYVPGYIQIEQLKKEAQRIGEERGKMERDKEIAKKSLEEGLSIELISKLTGLSTTEIEKL